MATAAASDAPFSREKTVIASRVRNSVLSGFQDSSIVRARWKSNFVMAESPPISPLRWYQRILMGLGGLVLAILLATAAWLTPSSAGLGTHQQLGLPPCTLVQLTGTRCPSCGMTTSWSHLMKGNVWGSLKANTAGCLLGLISLFLAPWMLSSAVIGRLTLPAPSDGLLISITVLVVAVTLGDWLIRINM